ncbi:MAG: 3-oxoacyl-[acyl-carrier-protein] synthase III C-terminal domain-containing protein [Dehalococcoidales bacterium]|nr:3-oxoacyl-[acyl-carrier-protein] synthase III C-terminal domain-containing protein [Dehalococcoidales bacterium]
MAGIISYGAYIPYYRLPVSLIAKAWEQPGGRGELAIANYDEDPVSMSVAAGMDCLKGINPKTVDALFLATTSAPYKERQSATIAGNALDLRSDVRNADFSNSLRAGTNALLAAFDAAGAGSAKSVLVTASDVRLGAPSGANEQMFGNGAAALLVGNGKTAVEFEGSYSVSEDMGDAWRSHEDIFVKNWEDRFVRDELLSRIPRAAVAAFLKKLNLAPKDFAKVCMYGTNARVSAGLIAAMGFKPEQIEDPLLETVGNTGAAMPLMILVAALEKAKAGDRILVISWGSGCDVISLKVTEDIGKIGPRRGIKGHLAIKKTLGSYEKLLRWRNTIQMEAAARPEKAPTSMATLWREHRSALPLIGAKCKKCGTPQQFLDSFSTRARVCLECGAKDEFEPYRFADKRGKVASFSHDFLALSQDPPTTLTVIDFEGGGRATYAMSDRDPQECKVGMMVEMTFRKIYYSRGIHNYFWKCKPARD